MQSNLTTLFFTEISQIIQFFNSLKQQPCPQCRQCGFLIRNGRAYGYAEQGSEQVIRSQRIFCSNRWRRQGCGKTFRLVLGDLLHHCLISSVSLWQRFDQKLQGINSTPPLPSYWWRRLRACQSSLREKLLSLCAPPQPAGDNPITQTLLHLKAAFSSNLCPIAAFQTRFQTRFFPN